MKTKQIKRILSASILLVMVVFYSCSKSSDGGSSTAVPNDPSNLTGQIAGTNIINLSWTDNSTNETGFNIERKTDNGVYSKIATVATNVTTYSDNTVTSNTHYIYRVNAVNGTTTSANYTNEFGINTTTGPDSLHVSLSSTSISNNSWDADTITVKDYLGNDITSKCGLYLNSGSNATYLSSRYFNAFTYGNFTISAVQGNLPSNAVPISISPSPYTHKILVEDYTSTLCGFCPREIFDLDTYTQKQKNCVWVAVHCGGLGADPYWYQYANSQQSSFGVTGYPSTIINRSYLWNEDSTVLSSELKKGAYVGLAINSSVSGTTISGTAQVKFNVTTNKSYKIVIALIESGVFADQDNYYSPAGGKTPYLYGGKQPITNFEEKNCLRATSTNLLGDVIPSANTVANNVYSVPFTFNTSGVTGNSTANLKNYTVNTANCKVVAYVVDANGAWNSTTNKGVLNVQYAPVGTNQPFD